jgi:hypothetical protein
MRIIEEIRGRNLPGVRDKREERDAQEKRDGWDALGMLNFRGWRNGQRSRCSEFQTQNFVSRFSRQSRPSRLNVASADEPVERCPSDRLGNY